MADPTRGEGELCTWQEIAAYLRVSKRQAQYWEANNGMPVHRMPGRKSRVRAYPSELDKWKLSTNNGGGEVDSPVGEDAGVGAESRGYEGRLSRRVLIAGAVGLGASSVAGAAWILRHRRPMVGGGIVGNTLRAWDEDGNEVWRHSFPVPPHARQGHNGMLRFPYRQVQMADLKGDGSKQVLFPARFVLDGEQPVREELYCFSTEGKLLWSYSPEFAVRFGSDRYTGPWQFSDLVIVPGRRGSVIWTCLEHWNWRPGVVLTVDGDGKAALKFVNGGHIYALGRGSYGGRNFILAGGVNNEYAAAALAILGEESEPACSPQTPGTPFECVDGPKGRPERYFLFPPTEVTAARGGPYNLISQIEAVNQEFIVSTREVTNEGAGAAMYRISKGLEPVEVGYDGSWGATHGQLQKEGKIGHGVRDCPHVKGPTMVRRWDGKSGWTTVRVPVATVVTPDTHQG